MEPRHIAGLNALLTQRGLTGKELAQRLGTTESTVSGWRRGLVPSRPNRERIYAELEVTPLEIDGLGWEKEPASV